LQLGHGTSGGVPEVRAEGACMHTTCVIVTQPPHTAAGRAAGAPKQGAPGGGIQGRAWLPIALPRAILSAYSARDLVT